MKHLITLSIAGLLLHSATFAQQTPAKIDMDLVHAKLDKYKNKTDSLYEVNTSNLVSLYTFRTLVQKDYSKITVGENSFSKVGRYATLSINADESKFYFTPIVFVKSKDPYSGSFKAIHSVDISGTVNSQNIFDFKSKKMLNAGYSFTYIMEGYTPADKARDVEFHSQIVAETYQQVLNKYKSASTSLSDYLDMANDFESGDEKTIETSIKKSFFDQLGTYEEKYYADKWKKKRISWFKMNITPVSWDNFSYVDATQPATLTKPGDKSVYTPSLKLSYNTLMTYPKSHNNQIYWAGYVAVTQKHSLSEISTPSQWYNFTKLTDSTVQVADDKKVFSLKDADFKTGVRADIGAQLICLFNLYKDMGIGFDLASSINGLVGNKSMAYVNKTSLGILLPFLDKDGESTINIEVFYQRKTYNNIAVANDGLWGIKFGLPFNKL